MIRIFLTIALHRFALGEDRDGGIYSFLVSFALLHGAAAFS
jgi:hypothetical protein